MKIPKPKYIAFWNNNEDFDDTTNILGIYNSLVALKKDFANIKKEDREENKDDPFFEIMELDEKIIIYKLTPYLKLGAYVYEN